MKDKVRITSEEVGSLEDMLGPNDPLFQSETQSSESPEEPEVKKNEVEE